MIKAYSNTLLIQRYVLSVNNKNKNLKRGNLMDSDIANQIQRENIIDLSKVVPIKLTKSENLNNC